MKRREFISIVGGAWAVSPFCARAQQSVPVVGFLSTRSAKESEAFTAGFRGGLSDGGYVEGRSIAVEYRWAETQFEKLPALAAELVALRVAVIATVGGPLAAFAARSASATTPIVFAMGDDPVRLGLVSSLSQPGGNITGVTQFASALSAKRLQLLRELVPHAKVIAILVNPKSPDAQPQTKEMQDAARAGGQAIVFLNASSPGEIDAAFPALKQKGASALVVTNDPLFNGRREQFAALAVRYAVPAMYGWRENVEAGGLVSYGSASLAEAYRQVGIYTARILKGAKPAQLPILQPTKFELTINRKAANALGLTIPQSLLISADKVIE